MPRPAQPEFFLDRGLGRRVAEELTELGWVVHRAAEHFSNDASDVSDADWLAYGLQRKWSPLCKDGRIKGRQAERQPLEVHGAVLFYLDNQQLVVAEMVRRFHHSQQAIYRAVARGGPRAYAVGRPRHPRDLALVISSKWAGVSALPVAQDVPRSRRARGGPDRRVVGTPGIVDPGASKALSLPRPQACR